MRKAFVYLQCEWPTLQSFFWSLLSGIIGTLILVGFFGSIMSMELLSTLLPLIVCFNAAISGYMLIDRTAGEIKREKTMATAIGMMVALLSLLSVNALYVKVVGFFLASASLAITAIVIGIIAGWSGGVLAVKYRKLKEEATVR